MKSYLVHRKESTLFPPTHDIVDVLEKFVSEGEILEWRGKAQRKPTLMLIDRLNDSFYNKRRCLMILKDCNIHQTSSGNKFRGNLRDNEK